MTLFPKVWQRSFLKLEDLTCDPPCPIGKRPPPEVCIALLVCLGYRSGQGAFSCDHIHGQNRMSCIYRTSWFATLTIWPCEDSARMSFRWHLATQAYPATRPLMRMFSRRLCTEILGQNKLQTIISPSCIVCLEDEWRQTDGKPSLQSCFST